VLATPAKNEQVKFVSGDADIKAMADVVKAADLGIVFPGSSSVRALRRGTVTCGTLPTPAAAKAKPAVKKGGKGDAPPTEAKSVPASKPEYLPGPCTVQLIPADEVRSVD